MSSQIYLISPVAQVGEAISMPQKTGNKPGALKLGLLDNGKFNAAELLDSIAERLIAAHLVSDVIRERKAAMSSPISPAALDRLTAECDIVLSAMAD